MPVCQGMVGTTSTDLKSRDGNIVPVRPRLRAPLSSMYSPSLVGGAFYFLKYYIKMHLNIYSCRKTSSKILHAFFNPLLAFCPLPDQQIFRQGFALFRVIHGRKFHTLSADQHDQVFLNCLTSVIYAHYNV